MGDGNIFSLFDGGELQVFGDDAFGQILSASDLLERQSAGVA